MSGYGGTGRATLLRSNSQAYMFQNEQPLAGTASVAFQLERISRSFYPWGASFQVAFTDVNGNPLSPGAFEIDIQTSDIDQDSQYCTIQAWSGTTSLNVNSVGRIELPNFFAKYIRAFVKSLSAGVYLTLLVTR